MEIIEVDAVVPSPLLHAPTPLPSAANPFAKKRWYFPDRILRRCMYNKIGYARFEDLW